MHPTQPRLLRMARDESGACTVVFRLGRADGGEIGIVLPASVREEDMLALARHRLHELLYESAAATAGWALPEARADSLAAKQPSAVSA